MANDELLIDWVVSGEKNTDEIVRYLNRIMQKYDLFTAFYVSENTRKDYYYEGILKKIRPENAQDIWYHDFKASENVYTLDVWQFSI